MKLAMVITGQHNKKFQLYMRLKMPLKLKKLIKLLFVWNKSNIFVILI